MRAKIITLKRARTLRANLTRPEVLLWIRLRHREPGLPIFRRQHAVGPYVLDFYCPAAKLAVEIDGAIHGDAAQAAHDQRRDAWLEDRGIHVYRVSARSVFADTVEAANGVRRLAGELVRAAERRSPPPSPALRRATPPP